MSNFIEIDNEYININSISAVGKIDRTNDGRICFYIFMTGGSENYFRISREADQKEELEAIYKNLIEKLMPQESKLNEWTSPTEQQGHVIFNTNDNWIAVEQALPENLEEVIVACEFNGGTIIDTARHNEHINAWQKLGRYYDDEDWVYHDLKITHWQPFPKPPKKD